MNTRSLIKAHRLALPVINFPVLLHWQPAISATDSQLPAASEASAAAAEKPWFRVEQGLPLPFCSSVLGRTRRVPAALHAPGGWDETSLWGPAALSIRESWRGTLRAQAVGWPEGAGAWLSGGVTQGRVVSVCMACSLFLSPCLHIFITHLPPLAGAGTGVLL